MTKNKHYKLFGVGIIWVTWKSFKRKGDGYRFIKEAYQVMAENKEEAIKEARRMSGNDEFPENWHDVQCKAIEL